MEQPKVSLCMPCYNAEPYLAEALDSALNQTYPNLEIVIVNDGSTDGSAKILEEYATKGVRVITQKNQGQCAAVNRAFEESSGDYIKFFDADDILSPEFIKSQVDRLQGSRTDIATARWGRFHNNDLNTFKLNPQSVWRDMKAIDWLVEAYQDARPMMQCAIFLIPREILEKSGGWNPDLSLINDFEFFSRVLSHCENILFTEETTLYYRSGIESSLSRQTSRKAVESAFQSIIKGTEHVLARTKSAEALRGCANMRQDFIYTFYPNHPDLMKEMVQRVQELGGSTLPPDGPPRFQKLRKLTGWKIARRIQLLAENFHQAS